MLCVSKKANYILSTQFNIHKKESLNPKIHLLHILLFLFLLWLFFCGSHRRWTWWAWSYLRFTDLCFISFSCVVVKFSHSFHFIPFYFVGFQEKIFRSSFLEGNLTLFIILILKNKNEKFSSLFIGILQKKNCPYSSFVAVRAGMQWETKETSVHI